MGRHGRDVSHSGSGEDEDYQRVGIFTKAITINIYIGGKIEVT